MKHFATTFVIASLIGAVSASADNITLLGTQDLDWQPTPEGVAFAALQGNRFEEAYQAMVELPAGTVSPPHVKSANMYGIVLGGQMAHYPSGDDPAAAPSIGPGGFYYIPAGLELPEPPSWTTPMDPVPPSAPLRRLPLLDGARPSARGWAPAAAAQQYGSPCSTVHE